jgi:small subunit ribosomal protein S1
LITNENEQATEPNSQASQTEEKAVKATKETYNQPFNWESSEKGDSYTSEDRKRMAQQYDQTLHMVSEHEIVEGTVVSITSKDVLVNIGYK